MKKNILLIDCEKSEVESLAQKLLYKNQNFEVEEHVANWKRTGGFSEAKRYGKYFWVGFKTFFNRKKYSAIVGWQQFYALIFCLFCELFKVKKTVTVVVLNFTYKEKNGKIGKIYNWFMRKCVSKKYLDFIHVPSENYADIVSETFSYPRERIIVVPFGVNDTYFEFSKLEVPEGFQKDKYALAIGRSNRDYDFLVDAWNDIDFPLVIISDTYRKKSNSDNITIFDNIAGEDSYPWIANCGIMVIPIDDGSVCSGDTVLLTAMMLERKLIVTKPSTLADMYIEDGVDAVLIEKKPKDLKIAIERILNDLSLGQIGTQARINYLNKFSRKRMGVAITERINTK